MSETTVWRPLAAGELAEQIWKVLHEIAEELRDTEPVSPTNSGSTTAELAVFFSYLAEALDDDDLAEVAMSYLERAIVALRSGHLSPGLFGGYTGIGWALQHLDGRLFDLDDDGLDAVDGALVDVLGTSSEPGDFDLISGLAGFAVYALDRLPRPKAREALETIVSFLEESSERDGAGRRTWFTAPELLPGGGPEVAPHGCYNLGVAHGIPGVIGVLALINTAGVCPETTGRMLDETVAWLLAQEQDNGARLFFPASIGKGLRINPSRLAWCYGDIGVAVTLLLAARHRGRQDWEREMLRIAHRSAKLPLAQAGVHDAGLCHGSAGLLHLFNRLYQATGEEAMAQAARAWLGRTLEIRQPERMIAGYPSWDPVEKAWNADASLLGGACGVGLALLAAVSPLAPVWDRLLLAR